MDRKELERSVKLLKRFGIREEHELAPVVPNEMVMAKNKPRNVRTLGDPTLMAESQKIYNPNMPPVKAKGPTAAQTELGVAPSLGTEGNWGTPDGR